MTPSLSVVIPAYNEENRLPQTLDSVLAYIGRGVAGSAEILVVDDGSTDGTAQLARRYGEQHPCVRLVGNPGNRGKGYSVRHGMLEARGAWRIFSDADLSTPIEELEKLKAVSEARGADIAIGSRALDGSLIGVHQSIFREYSGRAFNLVMRGLTGLPYADTQCGFKLYSGRAAEQVFSRQKLDGFSFDVEDLYIARKLRIYVVEVPVRWSNVEGTKVSTIQGMKSFLDVLRIREFDRAGRYR